MSGFTSPQSFIQPRLAHVVFKDQGLINPGKIRAMRAKTNT